MNISPQDTLDVLQITQDIIDYVGPRLSGSQNCKHAAQLLYDRFSKVTDHAHLESFPLHPEAFLGFSKSLVIIYYISTFILWIGGDWIFLSVIGYISIFFIILSQVIFYWGVFDRLFRQTQGYNVVGTIEPHGEVRQQIIISGHHDSAYQFHFLSRNQQFYSIRLVLSTSFFLLAIMGTLIWIVYRILFKTDPTFRLVIQITISIGIIFISPIYFFIGKKGTPGAGDNLIASVIALKIGDILMEAKKTEQPFLEHTRVIILSTDGEEAGLRGAAAFVKQHRETLLQIPTFNLCMDVLYSLRNLAFLETDINGTVKLSKNMAQDCLQIAQEIGYTASIKPIPFGGGATDTAEFAKIGVESTCIVAIPMNFVQKGLVYHTLEDTVDKVDSGIVQASLEIILKYLYFRDQQYPNL